MTINEKISNAAGIQAEETSQLLVCCAVFAALFMGLAVVFFDFTVIFASCIVGSYLAVRGVSEIIGGFPNEFTLVE